MKGIFSLFCDSFRKNFCAELLQAIATVKVSAIKRIIFIFIIYQIFNKEVLQ